MFILNVNLVLLLQTLPRILLTFILCLNIYIDKKQTNGNKFTQPFKNTFNAGRILK